MKKIIAIILCVAAIFSVSAVVAFADTTPVEPEATLDELFATYYNGGVYTRTTAIYVNDTASAANAFHGAVVTGKVTYFNENTLWMNTNSGYTGANDVEYPTEHFYYRASEDKFVNYTITEGDVRFYTMKYFDGADTSVWSKDGFVWTTEDSDTIEAVLGFAASCFTNVDKTTGEEYVELTKATVHKSGDGLVFRLYATNNDKMGTTLVGNELVVAETVVTTGIDGMQAAINAKVAN